MATSDQVSKRLKVELNDIEIIEGNLDDLNHIYARYSRDFPEEERKEYAQLETLLRRQQYKLLLAKHFDEFIGYAFIYEMDQLKFWWLDYMVIDVPFRNRGLGSLFFNQIATLSPEGIKGVFIEVEIPSEIDEASKEEQVRRIKFYERLGAKRLHMEYQLPTNHGGFPMYLYFMPTSHITRLPKEQIRQAVASAFEHIHSDVGQRYAILETFVDTVVDEDFEWK